MLGISLGSKRCSFSANVPLRESFADLFLARTKRQINRNHVTVVPNGATGALKATLQYWASLDISRRKVMVFTPAWFGFEGVIKDAGLEMLAIPTRERDGFMPSPNLIKQRWSRDVIGIIINNFATPTGASWSLEHARQLGGAILSLPGRTKCLEDCISWMNTRFSITFPTIGYASPELLQEGQLWQTASMGKGWKVPQDPGFIIAPTENFGGVFAEYWDRNGKILDPLYQHALGFGLQGLGLLSPTTIQLGTIANLATLQAAIQGSPLRIDVTPEGGTNVFVNCSSLEGKAASGKRLWSDRQIVAILDDVYDVKVSPGHIFKSSILGFRVHLAGEHKERFQEAANRIADFASSCV